jgi:hypothetical protein
MLHGANVGQNAQPGAENNETTIWRSVLTIALGIGRSGDGYHSSAEFAGIIGHAVCDKVNLTFRLGGGNCRRDMVAR